MGLETGAVLNNAIGSFIAILAAAVLSSVWFVFTKQGQMLWTGLGSVPGLRVIAVISAAGCLLALVALSVTLTRPILSPDDLKFELVEGRWSGSASKTAEGTFDVAATQELCPIGTTIVAGYCTLADVTAGHPTGYLEIIGFTGTNQFLCSWNGVNKPETFNGSAHAICGRIARK